MCRDDSINRVEHSDSKYKNDGHVTAVESVEGLWLHPKGSKSKKQQRYMRRLAPVPTWMDQSDNTLGMKYHRAFRHTDKQNSMVDRQPTDRQRDGQK